MKDESTILILAGVGIAIWLYATGRLAGIVGSASTSDSLPTSPSGTSYIVSAVPGMPAHDVGRGWWTPL